MSDALIELDQVSRHYQVGGEEVRALDEVSFSVTHGEYVAIIGASGSGKSTLLNVLGCLDTPTGGRYVLRGTNVRELSDAFIESYLDAEWPEVSACVGVFRIEARGVQLFEQIIGDQFTMYCRS